MEPLLTIRSTILLLVLAAPVGCGDDDDADPCGEPSYGGAATDEAWRTMVDAEDLVSSGDPAAPAITQPGEGDVLPAADPPVFQWTSTLASLPSRSGTRPVRMSAFWQAVQGVFEGTAWAHLPPVTGDIYYVQVTVPDRECEVRAVTTDLEWQVDGDSWTVMTAERDRDLSIRITSAYLEQNRISEGPYRPATPRTFRVAR